MSKTRTAARLAAAAAVAAAIVGSATTPASAGIGFELPTGTSIPLPGPVVQLPQPTIEYQTVNGVDTDGTVFALPEETHGQVWAVHSPGCRIGADDSWTLTVDTTRAESVVWTVDGEPYWVDSSPQATTERSPSLPMAGRVKAPAADEPFWRTPDLSPGTYQVEVQAFSKDWGSGRAGEVARFELTVRRPCNSLRSPAFTFGR